MRLTRIELHDVGPFADATFEIPASDGDGGVVLFEGPNGCGKTTLALMIAAAVSGGPRHLINNDPLTAYPAHLNDERKNPTGAPLPEIGARFRDDRSSTSSGSSGSPGPIRRSRRSSSRSG